MLTGEEPMMRPSKRLTRRAWRGDLGARFGLSMDVLRTHVDTRSEAYRANRTGFLEQIGYLNKQLDLVRAAGGEKYVARHLARGKLMARERIELLLDRDSPFLELAPLAAWGTEFGLGAGIISGVGIVSGVECVITANEPTMKGGTLNPY